METAVLRSDAIVVGQRYRPEPADAFLDGVRIANLDLEEGAWQVRVRLERGNLVVAERRSVIEVGGELVGETVAVTRNCLGKVCPDGSDDSLTECLDARCVAPDCSSSAQAACGGGCTSDADCMAELPCEQAVCRDRVCFVAARDDRCAAGHRCLPNRGCVEAPDGGLLLDGGGPLDSGAFDSGVDSGVEGDADVVEAAAADVSVDVSTDSAGPDQGMPGTLPCLMFDFESGLPSGWTTDGNSLWRTTSDSSQGGMSAVRAGELPAMGTTQLRSEIAMPADGLFTFWMRVESEQEYDAVDLSVNGAARGFWSGQQDWARYSLPLREGRHSMVWSYRKQPDPDNGMDTTFGADTVWIDDASVSGIPPSATTGFEAAALPAGYSSFGQATWFVAADQARGGAQSLRSGEIDDGIVSRKFSALERPVWIGDAGGTVTFWGRASSQAFQDLLTFWVDGVEDTTFSMSGEVDWTEHTAMLPSGFHVLQWRFTRNFSGSGGENAVWIDDVEVTGETGATTCVEL